MQNAAVKDGALGVAQAVVELSSVALDFESLYGEGKPSKGTHKNQEVVSTMEIGDRHDRLRIHDGCRVGRPARQVPDAHEDESVSRCRRQGDAECHLALIARARGRNRRHQHHHQGDRRSKPERRCGLHRHRYADARRARVLRRERGHVRGSGCERSRGRSREPASEPPQLAGGRQRRAERRRSREDSRGDGRAVHGTSTRCLGGRQVREARTDRDAFQAHARQAVDVVQRPGGSAQSSGWQRRWRHRVRVIERSLLARPGRRQGPQRREVHVRRTG